jgi:phosphate acetyltransferase
METKTVILPEGDDPRIIEAAHRLQQNKIVTPILLTQERTENTLECIDPQQSDWLPEFARAYTNGPRKVSQKIAARLVKKPLYFGGMMVATGKADMLVAGVAKYPLELFSDGFPELSKPGPAQIYFCRLCFER